MARPPVTPRAVEATAPAAIDLAGGLLDVWPLYLFHPGALAVSVAIDRRAWCRVETGVAGIRIESKDTLEKAEGRDVSELSGGGVISLVAFILRALDIRSGVKVVVQSRVPPGSGLGGSSALAVAVTAAAARAVGRDLQAADLWPIARDAEAQCLGVPVGIRCYIGCIHGGVTAVHLEAGRVRAERVATDPARVEESLLMVDTGAALSPGIDAWQVCKGRIEGDARVQSALARMASAASGLREALVAHRYDDVAALIDEEWEARKLLAPGVTNAGIDRVAGAALARGGAAKACGRGGGGVVVVWAGPGKSEAVAAAVRDAGFRPFPFRLDLRGLEVE